MSQEDFDKAVNLIHERHYTAAYHILTTLAPEDPMAQDWLVYLYTFNPELHPSFEKRHRLLSLLKYGTCGFLGVGIIPVAIYLWPWICGFCCFFVPMGMIEYFDGTPTPYIAQTSEPESPITTSIGETIVIPGEAYLNGRYPHSNPTSTIMTINISNWVTRDRVVCKLKHGTKVNVISSQRHESEKRYYLQVETNGCTGWVSDSFISSQHYIPLGKKILD